METLQEQFNELSEIRRIIESAEFQKYVIKPMKDYSWEQKNNFFSDSVKDQWRKGGRVEAVDKFFKILDQTATDYKNVKHDLES